TTMTNNNMEQVDVSKDKNRQTMLPSQTLKNEDLEQNHDDGVDDESIDDSQKVTESIVSKVERTPLVIGNINLEDIFEEYYNKCKNNFDIRAFEALYNILKSGDLEENLYNAQFISPILLNTLVLIKSSKHRWNTNFNLFVDRVLSAKYADGLARLWESCEEFFIYEQTGASDYDDFTDFYVHDTTSLPVGGPPALSAGSISWFCKYNHSFTRKSGISSPQSKNGCGIPAIFL
ncbi:39887_t:CDS:2, partial [Gigaspora margarita]